MAKQKLLLAFAILLSALAFSAQPPSFSDKYALNFDISVPGGGGLPHDSLLFVRYLAADGRNYSTVLASKDGYTATLYSNSAVREAEIVYDDSATPSPDGYWEGQVASSSQQASIMMEYTGDVAGVLSSEEGAVIAGADIELLCGDGSSVNATTTSTGSFHFDRVRTGNCIISANANGKSVHQDFVLARGELKSLGLQFRQDNGTAVLVAVLILLGIAAAWKLSAGKPKEPGKKYLGKRQRQPQQAASKPDPTQRQSDLLATLDSKEKEIVSYMLHHSPSAVRVSKLRRELLIPKTSLTRTLMALERKQFIKVEKVGSRMFVKLHDFFRQG